MTFRQLLAQEIGKALKITEPTAAALLAGDIGVDNPDMPVSPEMAKNIRHWFKQNRKHVLDEIGKGFTKSLEEHAKNANQNS